MASLMSQKTATAILWVILDNKSTSEVFEYYGRAIDRGGVQATSNYASSLFNSDEGVVKYSGKSDDEILKSIYYKVYSTAAEDQVINGYLSSGKTIPEISSMMITDLLSYNGTDKDIVEQQNTFESEINKIVFTWDGKSDVGSGALDVSSIYYVLGDKPENFVAKTWGGKLNNKEVTFEFAIEHFLALKPELNNGTDEYFLNEVFDNALGRTPSVAEKNIYLARLASGESKVSIISGVINDLKSTTGLADYQNYEKYILTVTGHQPGEMPTGNYQEKMVATYLALPQRDIDAEALVYYSRILEKGKSYQDLMGFLLGTKEFQNKGAALNGIDYIKHVFGAFFPNDNSVNYDKLWAILNLENKSEIVDVLLNEFRYHGDYKSELILSAVNNPSVYYSSVTNFEEKIGNILNYKTVATLNSGVKDYDVIGHVNTGIEHTLSYAEWAILKSVDLYINSNIKIDLTTAKNLMELNVYGSKPTEFVSHTVSSSQFIDRITLYNENITTSVNGNYYISPEVNMSLSKFNFGFNNNINVFWDGNSVGQGANHVSNDVVYKGYGTISANLITKQIVSTEINGIFTNTVSSNIANFASVFTYDTLNLGWLDLGGYIGKTEAYRVVNHPDGSVSHEVISTQNNTFDAGLINSPSHEGLIADIWKNSIPEVRVSNGNQAIMSFTLSKKADDVHVLNYWNRVDNYDLQITGDVTRENKLTFHLADNALYPTQILGLYYTAGRDTYAGSINYISERSGSVFDNFDIYSYGNDEYSNHLDLFISAQVNSLSINGTRHLDLNIDSYTNDITKIVLNSSRGVDIDFKGGVKPGVFDVAGSGNIDTIVSKIQGGLNAPDSLYGFLIKSEINSLSLNKFSHVNGSTYFNYAKNVVPTDTLIDIDRSVYGSEVIINKFAIEKFTLLDQQSDIVISSGLNGSTIKDYGTILTSQTEPHGFNLEIGVQLTDRVGAFGYANTNKPGVKMSAIVVDSNSNHIFDANDTLIIAFDVNSHDIASGMSYSPLVEINGALKQSELSEFL